MTRNEMLIAGGLYISYRRFNPGLGRTSHHHRNHHSRHRGDDRVSFDWRFGRLQSFYFDNFRRQPSCGRETAQTLN